MVKRSDIGLCDIATSENLGWAFWRASRGRRAEPAVRTFAANFARERRALIDDLRQERMHFDPLTTFRIHDPKPRTIAAPSFRDRVLHHAMMRHVGPVLDRALIDDTFACRRDKGVHRAVRRAQHYSRRYPWFVKADVRAYFASIDHEILAAQLARRLKSKALLRLLAQVVHAYAPALGRGLPIGALTSQHFANFYLSPVDRFLTEADGVSGIVRYMDDVVWWCRSRAEARATAAAFHRFAADALRLEVKSDVIINRVEAGLPFLGFRVFPGALKLSRRRCRRYTQARLRIERAYLRGEIDALTLQRQYDAVLAITAHADCAEWRRRELARNGTVDA